MDHSSIFRLDGSRALVVGAARGIGREVALGLAHFGATVTCADLDEAAAGEVAAAIGNGAASARVDVTDAASVDALLAGTGVPDVVVTTVGTNVRKRIADYAPEDLDRVLRVNLVGTFNVLRGCGPAMAAAGGGSITAFSSVRALTVEPGQGVYAATKAGVVQLVRTAAAEFGRDGVRVNAIAPGVVETELTAQIRAVPSWYEAYAAKTALGRWARPEELVGAAVYLASRAGSYVTGSVLYVDGGWTAIDGRFEPPA